jgi:hypothetical protein
MSDDFELTSTEADTADSIEQVQSAAGEPVGDSLARERGADADEAIREAKEDSGQGA